MSSDVTIDSTSATSYTRVRKEVTLMSTGRRPASTAGTILANRNSTKAEKSVAASDLAQAKGKGGKK